MLRVFVVLSALGLTSAIGIIYGIPAYKMRIPRDHGPWCIIVQRIPFGNQILFQCNSQKTAVKWRARNRAEIDAVLHLMTRDAVDRLNAQWMATEEWWALVGRLQAGAVVEQPTTPATDALFVPVIAKQDTLNHVETLINDAQLLADGLRTLRRKVDIPTETTDLEQGRE